MILSGPAQFGQCSMPSSNTRARSRTELTRAGWACVHPGPRHQRRQPPDELQRRHHGVRGAESEHAKRSSLCHAVVMLQLFEGQFPFIPSFRNATGPHLRSGRTCMDDLQHF